MNCLEYRRVLLGGEAESAPMAEHRLQCPSCAACFAEHERFERELLDGLSVPLPAGLDTLVTARVPGSGRTAAAHRSGRRRVLLAAAAGVAALGVGLHAWRQRQDALAIACIQFVMKEEAKSIMMGALPRDEAARVLADTLPLERIESVGRIRHVGPCPFNGGTAYHVVLEVPQDKVTLLVMPGAPRARRAAAVYDDMYAEVVPLPAGAVGVIGMNRDVVASVAGALRG